MSGRVFLVQYQNMTSRHVISGPMTVFKTDKMHVTSGMHDQINSTFVIQPRETIMPVFSLGIYKNKK